MTGGRRLDVDPRRGREGRPAADLEVAGDPAGLPAVHGHCRIQTLAPGLTQLRALEGTRLELEAEANKPLAHAELRIGEDPAGGALAFDASRTRFKTALPVKGSFTFWFDLKDTEGFRNREAVRYDVRGFRDEAPRVVIDEPKTDRDVPADATIPVRVVLDDDFGLHSARLDLPGRHRRLRAARRRSPSPSGRPRTRRPPRPRPRSSSTRRSPTTGSSPR